MKGNCLIYKAMNATSYLLKKVKASSISNYRSPLARSSFGSFSLKLASIFLAFLTSILLTRLLGVEEYGAYSYVLNWILLLSVFAQLGMDQFLVEMISTYCTKGEYQAAKGILKWSNLVVCTLSVGILIFLLILTWTDVINLSTYYLNIYIVALIYLPFLALTKVRQGALQGFKKVVAGQVPELLIQPLLFILILLGLHALNFVEINALTATIVKLITVVVAFLIGSVLLVQVLPKEVKISTSEYRQGLWVRSIFPYVMLSSVYVIDSRVDILMLGMMNGSRAVGLYTVASRGAEFLLLIPMAMAMAARPRIAELFVLKKNNELKRIFRKTTWLLFALTLPITLTLIIFGKYFLAIFGAEFIEAHTALTLLCIGRLFNATFGMVGPVLSMTGNASEIANNVATTVVLNAVLNFMLIPRFGLEGAAVATMISIIVRNLLLMCRLHMKFGILRA